MQSENMQYWSMTEGVFNCLIDTERTKAFKKAIQNTVKKGDVVVDMGTGSGVLAMLAADSGASMVYAVEIDKKNVATLKDTFATNGYSEVITILEGDATTISLPEKIDVIISEMVATGLIEELQVQAMNNMLRFGKENVRVLLNKMEQYIDLVYNNNSYYGHTFNIVRYEYPDINQLTSVAHTNAELYSVVDFSKPIRDTMVKVTKRLFIDKDGTINSLRISNKTIFFDGSTLGATFAYCFPVILPISEQIVKAGEIFTVSLSYTLCGGFDTLAYSVYQ